MLLNISKLQMSDILHSGWNKFPVLRSNDVVYGRSGNKRSNLSELKFSVKFCDTEAEKFQVNCFI